MKLDIVNVDCLIIGAGVAGLSVGRELSLSYQDIFIIEKNKYIGEEISSRNSEVIHAGIYYKNGSLKPLILIYMKLENLFISDGESVNLQPLLLVME